MAHESNYRKRVEDEVSKTLGSLDNMPDLEVGGSFYAIVQQKLGESTEAGESWLGRLLFGPRLGPVFFAAMILVNVGTMYFALSGDGAEANNREKYIEAIADEYSLSASSVLSAVGDE